MFENCYTASSIVESHAMDGLKEDIERSWMMENGRDFTSTTMFSLL
jgi:hypothetical protein